MQHGDEMPTIEKITAKGNTLVKKSWGHEIWFANTDLYCGKELFIARGKCSSDGRYHYHKIKDETFYVLRGILQIDYFDNEFHEPNMYVDTVTLRKGESFRIYPYTSHRFMAVGLFGCKFIEASTHHEDDDSYYDFQPHLGV